MSKKRTYRAVKVETLDTNRLLDRLGENEQALVSLDIAKHKMLGAITTRSGDVIEIIRFDHPTATPMFLDLVARLATNGHSPVVILEPTGTYGDALRYQLGERGIPVYRVSTKHVSDSKELFDRVPSKHDAKDACVIAWLHANGRSTLWTPMSATQRRLRALVASRDAYDAPLCRLRSQLEPLLARHFPEFEAFFDLANRRTPLVLLGEYPAPADLAAAGVDAVADLIRRSARRPIDRAGAERLVAAARESLGAPMIDEERQLVRMLVAEMLRLMTKRKELDEQIATLGQSESSIVAMRPKLGATTAAVVVAHMGSPADYGSAAAFEKAVGFNLKEHSSGTRQGRLQISKRGPARVRKYLFLAALRLVQTEPVVRAWYMRRRGYTEAAKLKAVVAVARKLARALVHVARGEPFDVTKLFDVRRLGFDEEGAGNETRVGIEVLIAEDHRLALRPQWNAMGEELTMS